MRLFRVIGLLSVILTCGIAFGANVKTDYDSSFDFARLRTFTFRSEWKRDRNANTLVDNRIQDALKRDLEARGFRYVPDGPADFVVAYYTHEQQKVEPTAIGYGMPYRWRWGWGPAFWTRYYTEGSVLVDFVTQSDRQLVWRGRVTNTVSGLDESKKQIDKGVKDLVSHFEKDVRKSEKRES